MTQTRHDFKIGDGATYNTGSDRHPCTVVRVTPTRVTVRDDNWTRVGGSMQDGSAEYSFSENPTGHQTTFSLRRNGRMVMSGGRYGLLSHGRSKYHDPHF